MRQSNGSLASKQLLAGAAEIRITPRPPVQIAGYYNIRVAKRVRDDLFCRACVLRVGRRAFALVSCDLITIPRNLVEGIRSDVIKRTDLRNFACMIGATHTHSAPSTLNLWSYEADQAYLARVRKAAVDAVLKAFHQAVPARVGAGSGKETSTVFNRRFLMRDGRVKTNPGVRNRDIVRPVGPVDPEVGILKVIDANNRPVAAIVNFTNHTDTLGLKQVSADWPGVASRKMKQALGPQIVTLVFVGAAGDVNHVNVRSRTAAFGPTMTEKVGAAVAKAVLTVWDKIKAREVVSLAAICKQVSLPLKQISGDELAQARRLLRGVKLPFRAYKDLTAFDLAKGAQAVERLHAQEILALTKHRRRTERGELQAIAVGEAVFVAVPGELFVKIGLAIKKASPFRKTFIVGLANGYMGYMTTDEAQRVGGYESKPARSSRLGLGTEKIVASNCLRLLRRAAAIKA